jgi:hypothetical protein
MNTMKVNGIGAGIDRITAATQSARQGLWVTVVE